RPDRGPVDPVDGALQGRQARRAETRRGAQEPAQGVARERAVTAGWRKEGQSLFLPRRLREIGTVPLFGRRAVEGVPRRFRSRLAAPPSPPTAPGSPPRSGPFAPIRRPGTASRRSGPPCRRPR